MANQDTREINEPIRAEGNDKEKGWFQKRRGVVIGVLIGLYALQVIAVFAVPALYPEEFPYLGPQRMMGPPDWLVLVIGLVNLFEDFCWTIGLTYIGIGFMVWIGALDRMVWRIAPFGKRPNLNI